MKETNQFTLLGQRKFLPFFLTQALGAFNDNLYKNTLLGLLTFIAANQLTLDTNIAVNMAAGLFILPFFLFSATAGQLADKYDKALIMKAAKFAEILIMLSAAWALLNEAYFTLMAILFLMGTQSTFFGPAKYAILPQHLKKEELVSGNALVEMGTFLTILLGTIAGGLVIGYDQPHQIAAMGVLIFAILGFLASLFIPSAPSHNKDLIVGFNPIKETYNTFRQVRQNHNVLLSIMAISWFWFMGASYLTQIPNLTKEIFHGDNLVMTLLLTLFSIGIAVGSLLCDRLSGHKVEIGIVPIGSIGLSIFGIDLFFQIPDASAYELVTIKEFLQLQDSYRFLFDLSMIGMFGGLFIVPLYAYIQDTSEEGECAQTIAANNILNALFMVVSAICGALMLGLAGLTIPQFFLAVALMNIAVAIYVYSQVPEFALRFIIWTLGHTVYRVTHKGLENIPDEGPAVLVCNHVSYMDSQIIGGACRRPIRFVMDFKIYNSPALNWFFKTAKTIPIASQKKDPELYNIALNKISEELKLGNLVCIFPEGKLTMDGEIDQFRKGIETIIERDAVPVVPMALQGLWGSFFSHKDGTALSTRPKRFWSKVNIIASEPWKPEEVTAQALEEKVKELRGDEK